MIFAQPLFLIALIAIAIPVLVHLFNFRKYKKIYFTNVRYLSEITQETRKRNELKHLLILAARILAISALVLAFARPFIPSSISGNSGGKVNRISIYIDNSFSMEALTPSGTMLDEAKQKAIEIASASSPSSLFQLTTNDFEGKHRHFSNRDDFIRMVKEIKISPAVRDLDDIMKQQTEILFKPGSSSFAYVISDFQKSTSVIFSRHDSTVDWFMTPVPAGKVNNLYIDSVWFDSPSRQPGQSVRMNVRIRNSSGESFEKIPLKLFINGNQKAVGGFSVEGMSETTVTLPYTNEQEGMQLGTVEITDYPVTWDDRFFISYIINPAIPVLCINNGRENIFLDALYGNDSAFIYRTSPASRPDYSSFSRYSLIILNGIDEISSGMGQELIRFVTAGGSLVIIPGGKDASAINTFLAGTGLPQIKKIDTTGITVSDVNLASPVFTDVFENNRLPQNPDLPFIKKHYQSIRISSSGAESLMKLQNGDEFFASVNSGRGKIYMLYSSLEQEAGNFSRHTLFVPVFYRIALLSQQNDPLFNIISDESPVSLPGDSTGIAETVKLKLQGTSFEIIPEMRHDGQNISFVLHDQSINAGNYLVYSGDKAIRPVSVNYDRKESALTYYSASELKSLMKERGIKGTVLSGKTSVIGNQIREMTQGIPLWKYFIIAALLFLLSEILLIRLMKE